MTKQITDAMESGRAVAELILIRHGATELPDRLHGRSDPALAAPPGKCGLHVAAIRVSPAQRARQTAEGLFPGQPAEVDDRLWEQDFGAWDGRPYVELPDLGPLENAELADHAPERGESFTAMVERVGPALAEAAKAALDAEAPVAIVAHAGTIRAALAVATGDVPSALSFEIGYLSATRLRCLPGGKFSVVSVNGALA